MWVACSLAGYRMPALFSSLYIWDAYQERRGRPPVRWEKCDLNDLGVVGVSDVNWERDDCQLKCFGGRCSGSSVTQGQERRPLRASGRRRQQTTVQNTQSAAHHPSQSQLAAVTVSAEGVNLLFWGSQQQLLPGFCLFQIRDLLYHGSVNVGLQFE